MLLLLLMLMMMLMMKHFKTFRVGFSDDNVDDGTIQHPQVGF